MDESIIIDRHDCGSIPRLSPALRKEGESMIILGIPVFGMFGFEGECDEY